MRGSGRILMILGVVLALLSGIGMYALLLSARPAPAEVATTQIIFAFQTIPERSEVTAAQVGPVDWPQSIPAPIGSFTSAKDVVGKFSTKPIYPGEPILDKMLIDKASVTETHSNAAYIVEEGSVAIAIPVSMNTSVAEAVQAGDRVDLIGTFTTQPVNAAGQNVGPTLIQTQRLLQDVLVLQVGPWPRANAPADSGTRIVVVTLQVNLQDAQVAKFAQVNATDLSLALRPFQDHAASKPDPVTFDYLFKRFGFKLSGQ